MKVTSCHKLHKPNTWTWNRFGNYLDHCHQIKYHLSISRTIVGCHSINSRTAGCCHSTICSPSIIVITGTKDYSNFKTAAQSSSILRASSKEKESEREQRNKTEDSKYVVFLCTNERVRVIEVPMEIFESEGKVNRRCGNEL